MADGKGLVLDVGCHQGEDIGFYLARGHRVVAVDANEDMIRHNSDRFPEALARGQLTLLNRAIYHEDDVEVDFFLSHRSIWSSLNQEIAGRERMLGRKVRVRSVTLPGLIRQYGLPEYCKIDLEGFDRECVETLRGSDDLPRFISVESECGGDSACVERDSSCATLESLYGLGYRKFKLVDQTTLEVLARHEVFYQGTGSLARMGDKVVNFFYHLAKRRFMSPEFVDRVMTKVVSLSPVNAKRMRLKERFDHYFDIGASGPFGHDLEGEWMDYTEARETLLFHRDAYYRMKDAYSYGFWCDWHATW